jgi:hypothetical protein
MSKRRSASVDMKGIRGMWRCTDIFLRAGVAGVAGEAEGSAATESGAAVETTAARRMGRIMVLREGWGVEWKKESR